MTRLTTLLAHGIIPIYRPYNIGYIIWMWKEKNYFWTLIKAFSQEKSWFEADAICKANFGSRLTSIHSESFNDRVSPYIIRTIIHIRLLKIFEYIFRSNPCFWIEHLSLEWQRLHIGSGYHEIMTVVWNGLMVQSWSVVHQFLSDK